MCMCVCDVAYVCVMGWDVGCVCVCVFSHQHLTSCISYRGIPMNSNIYKSSKYHELECQISRMNRSIYFIRAEHVFQTSLRDYTNLRPELQNSPGGMLALEHS